MTEQEKQQALENARKMLAARQGYAQKTLKNSFDEWGNDKCIGRTMDTIDAMKRDSASDRQYRYWLTH